MKTFLIILSILVLVIIVLFIIIKVEKNKIKSKDEKIKQLISENSRKQEQINLLSEEIEIERKYKKELAKKIADISCMSIDDVLSELQND